MILAERSLRELVEAYDERAPLAQARTIPAAWYRDPRIGELERRTVFARSWQVVGRADQLAEAGQYVTALVAGEPIAVVRGGDAALRGFFNVCRHHAAAVLDGAGRAAALRCPYHGWTYSLEGELRGTPDFDGVRDFERSRNGLLPVAADVFEGLAFVRIEPEGPPLQGFLGDFAARLRPLGIGRLRFFERRVYELGCNWKVFVDNYLDGGYHVPHLHKGLNSVLDYAAYSIENGQRYCLQSSPLGAQGAEPETGAVRQGERACYFWLYPNFMLNLYDGMMDTNLVLPLGLERTRVVFDFYFGDVSEAARERNRSSVEVGDRIQREDVAICESVQRGLGSRAYDTGRLSVRREAGEHLFHRLLAADLRCGMESP